MAQKSLEVLGISSLHERCFLVYFSDKTYATVSSSQLAQLFPQRQAIPESVMANRKIDSSFHASHSLRDADVLHDERL